MLFLAASGTQQPDFVALAMVLVMALIVAVLTVRKYLSKKNVTAAAEAPAAPAAPAPAIPTVGPIATGSAGKL